MSPDFWRVFNIVAGAVAGLGAGIALALIAIVAAIFVINMLRG